LAAGEGVKMLEENNETSNESSEKDEKIKDK
jgi:hypothetical protein